MTSFQDAPVEAMEDDEAMEERSTSLINSKTQATNNKPSPTLP